MKTLLALLLLGSAAPALAQTPPAPPLGGPVRGGMLMRADANGDGVITRDEAAAAADQRFDRMDANHDGTVTPDERPAMRSRNGNGNGPPPPPPPADGARPTGPAPMVGPMTREQSRARALEMFDRADANRDGRVDQAELAQMRGPRGPGPHGDMPPPPPQD